MVEMAWRSTRAAEWIEKHCRVPEGMKVGQPIELHPVQLEILAGVYDSPTRQAFISFGKKNGKTTLSSALTNLHLAGPESRPNSQLYSLGQSKEQAGVLYALGSKMVRMSAELSSYVVPRDTAKQLACPERGTLYEALSAEASTAHGKSPAFLIHDELGQVRGPTSDLYSALELSMGAHEDPLSIVISTQAPTDADLLSVLIDDALKSGDPRIKVFLWAAPDEADPWAEATWKLANPMYGITLNPEAVRDAAEKAKRMPAQEAQFRNYVLNQRVDTSSPLITRSVWQACSGEPEPEALEADHYLGLDLSARNDLTAMVSIARLLELHDVSLTDASNMDGMVWSVRPEFFAPSVGLHERAQRDRASYDVWAREGLITLTPGASVDYEIPAQRLIEICEDRHVVAVAFDRWRIDVFIKELARLLGIDTKADDMRERVLEVVPLVPHGQGFRDMSPALDAMEAALLNGKMRHGGHPVLTWCAANAKASRDPAGNRKLDKIKSTGRIDGIQALAMAFGAAGMITEGPKGPSVYESRGLLEV